MVGENTTSENMNDNCEICMHYCKGEEGKECHGFPQENDPVPTEDEILRWEKAFDGLRPVNDCPWMKVKPNDLTFVDMDNDAEQPVEVGNLTGFKPGQKLVHLTELGGQPWMRIVTFEKEVILGGGIGLVIYVKEMSGYIDDQSLYSLEHIQKTIDDYTEEDARQWRAINDGIAPAPLLHCSVMR